MRRAGASTKCKIEGKSERVIGGKYIVMAVAVVAALVVGDVKRDYCVLKEGADVRL